VRIRLHGTPEECHTVAAALHRLDSLDVVSRSDPYPDRGDSRLVRVYVEARLRAVGEEP
jgi:hypothetical protein